MKEGGLIHRTWYAMRGSSFTPHDLVLGKSPSFGRARPKWKRSVIIWSLPCRHRHGGLAVRHLDLWRSPPPMLPHLIHSRKRGGKQCPRARAKEDETRMRTHKMYHLRLILEMLMAGCRVPRKSLAGKCFTQFVVPLAPGSCI